MSNGYQKILSLSVPIMAGMVSQNILNLVDTLMIGTLGTLSLSGSGIGSFLFYVFFIGFIGISAGVQTMVARYIGENKPMQCSPPLILGLGVAIIFSIFITVVVFVFSEILTSIFSDNAMVAAIGHDYLSFRILGLPFLAICLVIRGFWNGQSSPLRYLKIIVFVHLLNIGLNYILIFGHYGFPVMGVSGAGLASTLALMVGAMIYLIDCRYFLTFKLKKSHIHDNLPWLAKLSIPIFTQQTLFASGVAIFYWILSQIGTDAMAIGAVLVNIVLIAILPGAGIGMATMTLVSESIGMRTFNNAYKWPFKSLHLSVLIIGSFSIIIFCFPTFILTPFFIDLSILNLAIVPIRLDAIGVLFEVGAIIFMNALNGADKTRFVAWTSTSLQWIILLPAAYFIGVHTPYGINGVWLSYLLFQVGQFFIFGLFWRFHFKQFI